jgi:hypothetical protein
MLSACSALRVPQKPSRAVALCGFLLHHIFAVAVNASHFLYCNRKNVIYLERYVQVFEMLCKILHASMGY